MDLSLKGKIAVVCGATQGIGEATAKELATLGAKVVLVARNEEKLQNVKKEIDQTNSLENEYIVADFSNVENVIKGIENWISKGNQAHILINNTGGPAGGPVNTAKLQEFTAAFEMHLLCNHALVQALIPGMKEAGYGRIVNVISTSVKQPLPNLGVSNTIRGAVANWSKTLANELGQFNITVNNVLPGATNTVRLKSIIENKAQKTGSSTDVIAEQMANASPMKRVARPEEVANTIAFLASPAASYINGINVPVDGGRTGCL